MKKIVYVCDYSFLKNKMNQQAYQKCMALVEQDNIMLVDIKRGEQRDAVEIQKEYKCDLIIQEHIQPKFPLQLYNLDKVTCETAMILGDMHELPNKITTQDFVDKIKPWKHILHMFDTPRLDELKKLCPNVHFHRLSMHIDTNIYKDYKLEKIYDVLIYGAMNEKYYPFRLRLKNILLNSDLNIKYIPEPSYSNRDKSNVIRGVELAKLINQSWLTVCTCSNVEYLVLKYLEIPACKSIPIGNVPTRDKVFESVVTQLDESESDEELLHDIKDLLLNKSKMIFELEKNKSFIDSSYGMNSFVKKVNDFAEGVCK